ncbi:BA75_01301T0 [Komagataella pastoris]|uniref:DNA helicase n=1 Tax=Komagataella pastoris TaxID=4922 RepID=A0A1B2J7Y2_PICPA|nr:BA75_01301T0 [Komagataella pastoris]
MKPSVVQVEATPEKPKPSFIQVPESSPMTKEEPATGRLDSLRKFQFQPGDESPIPKHQAKVSYETKKNIHLLRKKYPHFTAKEIFRAYISCNSSLKLTNDKLATMPIRSPSESPSTGALIPTDIPKRDPPRINLQSSKVNVGKKESISSRYLTRRLEPLDVPQASSVNSAFKKRKLVRASNLEGTTPQFQLQQPVLSLEEDEEEEEEDAIQIDDSDEEVDGTQFESASTDFEEKTLNFLNTADKRDIVDVANIHPSVADLLIAKRPFESLSLIEDDDFSDKPLKGRKKTTGEKIVEKASEKLRGYEAVENLIKQCSYYGNRISNEVKKWGVGVHGEKGELEVVEVDVDTEPEDSENDDNLSQKVNTLPNQSKTASLPQNTKRVRRKNKAVDYEEDFEDDFEEEEEEDDDEDYLSKNSPKKSITHANNKVGYFKRKPKLLSDEISLKNYQQVGVNWLNLLYQNNLSCILADEMGLGKTCQVIAFLAHLKQKKYPGPHMVVVPSSTLENWLREFRKFCPELIVQPYYGSQEERGELRYQLADSESYDVLVTTYNLATGNKYDQQFLRSREFNVIVYDEGHMLKNSQSERYAKLMRLGAHFRLLLTGTPLQNNLKELISLLAFILPKLFKEKKDDLKVLFDQKAKTTGIEDPDFNPLLSQQAISKARTMMAPFVLRRKKFQVLSHLPEKHHFIETCEFLDEQKVLYEEELEKVKTLREEREKRKLIKDDETLKKLPPLPSQSNLIMQLRKAALHPLLFRGIFTDKVIKEMSAKIMREPVYADANLEYIYEDMSIMNDYELNELCLKYPRTLSKYKLEEKSFMQSGKVQKLKELLDQIIFERKEKVLIFSLFTQVLDIIEVVLSIFKIKFLRLDGQTSVDIRQDIIDKFYEDETIPVFLLSTKAGGFGINLVCANNVIIFDQSFNPHDDKQAEDRAHRVGQTKEVNVYRMVTKNTIDESILQLALNKLQLDSTVSDDNDKSTRAFEEQTAKVIEQMLFERESSTDVPAEKNGQT